MRKGSECGMGFENWEAFEVGDQIQSFEENSEKRTLQVKLAERPDDQQGG